MGWTCCRTGGGRTSSAQLEVLPHQNTDCNFAPSGRNCHRSRWGRGCLPPHSVLRWTSNKWRASPRGNNAHLYLLHMSTCSRQLGWCTTYIRLSARLDAASFRRWQLCRWVAAYAVGDVWMWKRRRPKKVVQFGGCRFRTFRAFVWDRFKSFRVRSLLVLTQLVNGTRFLESI